MQLKIIDNDKVKILIEDRDDIDFEQLDHNSLASRELILLLLKEVYKKTGVNFLNSKVLIEVVAGAMGSHYIIVTRISPGSVSANDYDNMAKADGDMYLFELNCLENIFDVAGVFDSVRELEIGSTEIYKYKNKYYLAVDFPPETVANDKFYQFIKSVTEFCAKCRWNIINEALLKEWGELLSLNPIDSIESLIN